MNFTLFMNQIGMNPLAATRQRMYAVFGMVIAVIDISFLLKVDVLGRKNKN